MAKKPGKPLKMYGGSDTVFKKICEDNKIPPTKRQYTKYKAGKGRANQLSQTPKG